MTYYVMDSKRVRAFATRPDAIMYICDNLRYEGSWKEMYSDRSCLKGAGIVKYVGWGTFSFYPKGKTLDYDTPYRINPEKGTVYNPYKKKR